MREPSKLNADEQSRLQALLDRCPELKVLAGHVRVFAEMIRDLHGDCLHAWMDEVEADDLPALHSFVAGLRRDQDAVTAGLTLHWSSGPVEGHVNRLKILIWWSELRPALLHLVAATLHRPATSTSAPGPSAAAIRPTPLRLAVTG
jgi:hypothetical protein